MSKTRTICTNHTRTKKGHYGKEWDKYTFGECGSCKFLYTHKGQHWLDDEVRCDAPSDFYYKDELIETTVVKKKKRGSR